ncbi:hypothetical protein [Lentzea sp. E54]|uniref:hypothetical protein n=1 Tax=Lentzea xerophila TaxID=3435883 RepID=UPI003DA492C9
MEQARVDGRGGRAELLAFWTQQVRDAVAQMHAAVAEGLGEAQETLFRNGHAAGRQALAVLAETVAGAGADPGLSHDEAYLFAAFGEEVLRLARLLDAVNTHGEAIAEATRLRPVVLAHLGRTDQDLADLSQLANRLRDVVVSHGGK